MKKSIIKYLNKNITDLSSATILVLGGTGEIGSAIVEELVYLKAKVILAARNNNKAYKQIKGLKESYPDCNIELMFLDLTSKYSIETIDLKLEAYNITHAIINSAINVKNESLSYLVNCYRPYEIIKRLKDVNVIVTSSISYKSKKDNDYYSIHKRELMQLCYSLNKDGYNITLAHPGIVYTRLFYERNKKYMFIFPILKLFMSSTYKAALNILNALNKKIDIDTWVGPRGLFESFGYPKVKKLKKDLFNDENIILAKEHISKINM